MTETEIHRTDVKQMTHENFLAMLKGQKEDTKVMAEFEAATNKTKSNEKSKKSITQAPSSSSSSAGNSVGGTGRTGEITWNALLDDYPLAGQSMALKVNHNKKSNLILYLQISNCLHCFFYFHFLFSFFMHVQIAMINHFTTFRFLFFKYLVQS